MDFKEHIASLKLPKGSFIVVGSGILGALGIRESSDIDLVVDEVVFRNFKDLGWDTGLWGDKTVYQRGVFDIGNDWYGETAQDLLQRAQVIDDVPYLSLNEVYEWKKTKGREKDLRDIALIDDFRLQQKR